MATEEQGTIISGTTGEFLEKAIKQVANKTADRLRNKIRQIEEEKEKTEKQRRSAVSSSITPIGIKVDVKELLNVLQHRHLDIVFDGDPFNRHPGKAGLFAEVESPAGTGVKVGTWIDRGDGFWALRLTLADFLSIETEPKS